MALHDLLTDLTNLLHPMPPAHDPEGSEHEQNSVWCHEVDSRRREYSEHLRLSCEQQNVDPLLMEIINTRADKHSGQERMRLLLAYAREFASPHPYTLDDLAEAAGMSTSDVRTAYDDAETNRVATLIGQW